MALEVVIRHNTTYDYETAVKVWPQVIRLRPAPHSRTKIKAYSLKIQPANHFINWMQDPFGNYQARIVFNDIVKQFRIDVEVIAELVPINPFDFFLDEYAENFPFDYEADLKAELQPYLTIEESGPLLQSFFGDCQQYNGLRTVDFLVAINQFVYNHLNYTIRMEPGVQECEETLTKQLGSCRDFAWLLVNLFRHFGLAARFVSGYLIQLKPDENYAGEVEGPSDDFTDLHAWAEVYIPGAGWIGLDATSGLFAGEGHIPLACTPHPKSAAPITGSTGPTTVSFSYANVVERIHETPRSTKPLSSDQWSEVISLGDTIDEFLDKENVGLVMGGEPTFISIKDMESAQWNTDADGKDKRVLAFELTKKLKSSFAKEGMVHFGQGKWYPGEPVPRWQYGIYWRNDGEALWAREELIQDPNTEGEASFDDLKKLGIHLCKQLGLDKGHLQTAYEDEYYYLWQKEKLPVDVKDAEDSLLRKTLTDLMKKGLDQPVGLLIPLKWNYKNDDWQSCKWSFRRDKLFLIPGNSQMGYRLPLDSISIPEKSVDDIVVPTDYFAPLTLWSRQELQQRAERRTVHSDDKNKVFTTALCLEIREGRIHLFIPPLDEANHFLDLMYAVEAVASELKLPIVIDGYQPPYHNDLVKLAVTPDPGVIEVNIHPAKSWKDIVYNYDTLFNAAQEVGLDTNKFMLDGKHTGTGGGNHITLGGTEPKESPLLKRPDLLRSMVSFWQNHPSLSYLFSSTFIGPTSQAPRIDEGRPDRIYEMEIAFNELDKLEDPPYWMVDRLFRNLLTDLTGNTHRAEFCIDKLYSPDSGTGRLGILELRGFDMPPHKEMSLIQLLLIRALVAVFWKVPYRNKLINWGTDLHNKFMMHHFVKEDIHEVVDHLNAYGFAFKKEWLTTFLEFKFPKYGEVVVKGMTLTLRSGIEPWIVLGEEMSSSGTARYVDSSLERLELVVDNFNPERYALLCNFIKVPMIPTEYKGKYVAAIRYKAWAPYSALHPTIDVNSPLVFDIYDLWNERSIGGCTYHVVHPGGRNFETFPVNSLEAESRRTARFWEFNHNPKTVQNIMTQMEGSTQSYITSHETVKENIVMKQIQPSPEFPMTLDLRRE
jgi:uncharacterized protein (DUF2126 family)